MDNDLQRWRARWRREALRVDVDAEERRAEARAERRVQCWAEPDGMATVRALLPAEGAMMVMRGPTALAEHRDPDDERSMDQRRADALVDVIGSVLADATLPGRARQRAVIQATGGIRTLIGLANEPGELAGYGPITAQHLRELAADGDWQRFTTAPDTGALVGIGAASYRPSAALRRVMIAGEPQCDFPGCAVPSQRCDAEHTIAHARGGRTDPDNLRPRCRRHHRCKTHTDWSVLPNRDGSTTWLTPSGYQRTFPPTRLAGDEPGG